MSGRGAECAHPLEKSAPDLKDTSIHRLIPEKYIFQAGVLPRSDNEVRNGRRNDPETFML